MGSIGERTISDVDSNGPVPRMIRLEDDLLPDGQLGAAYESTRIDHEMKLSVDCTPNLARLTGFVVTLGERNSGIDDLTTLVSRNVDVVRLNLAHGDANWHRRIVNNLQNAVDCLCGRRGIPLQPPAVAADLPGPELRAGSLGTSRDVRLSVGDEVCIFTESNTKRIRSSGYSFGVYCPQLPRVSKIGDRISLNRGSVCVEISEVGNNFVKGFTTREGVLPKNGVIVEPLDTALDVTDLCQRDDEGIQLALELQCDFLVASGVGGWRRISSIKDRIKKTEGRPICVLAKISSYQGLEGFDDILKVSDGIVIDREGLKADVTSQKLFLAQKSMIAKCNRVGKPAVVTYRMTNSSSKKLELDLLATAVLEGVDAIHFATGKLNVKNTTEIIEDADPVVREAEAARWQRQIFQDLSYKTTIPLDPTHGMAIAAVEMSMKLNAAGIIVTTTTGRSAMLLSIYRPRCPIVAVTRYGIAARWLRIYFAVHPIHYRCPPHPDWYEDLNCRVERAMNYLRQWRYVSAGDPVVVVSGWRRGDGFTHSIRVTYAALHHTSDDLEETW